MLLDSGADVSLVPRQVVLALRSFHDAAAVHELMGLRTENRSVAQAVNLDMVFLARKVPSRFLLIDQERGILGATFSITFRCSRRTDLTWDERI